MSSGLVTSVIGCGAADGPTVKTEITDASGYTGNTSSSNYRGSTGFGHFSYGYADMNQKLMLPTITMMNLTGENKGTSGAKFTEAEYENAITGSTTKTSVNNLPAGQAKTDWNDLWRQYSTPADTYFTNVSATTISRLALVPYYKDLLNENYFARAAGASRFSIINAKANIVSFSQVQQALNFLNANAVANDVFNGSTDSKNAKITQEAQHAIVKVGTITYTVTYVGTKNTFQIPVVVLNLYARLDLVDYGLAITPNKPKELTYFQGWIFGGYDYYTDADAAKPTGSLKIPNSDNLDLYVGFYNGRPTLSSTNTFTKAATKKADTKKTDQSTFPKQTSSKKGINYKDFQYFIDVAKTKEESNQ